MAFDGMMMSLAAQELREQLNNGIVSQIHQPGRDEIIISFRTYSGNKKLLICARADTPRLNITKNVPENPNTPPMLCMLLRKKLSGAKLKDIKQTENERILFFVFDSLNDIGDIEEITLCAEIMGKYSNVILIDKDNKVIDSLKRVDMSMSRERLIFPKIEYELPKKQDKICLTESTIPLIIEKALKGEKNLDKEFLSLIQGMSPIVARELDCRITSGEDIKEVLKSLLDILSSKKGTPLMLIREDGSPFDISFIDINQYGASVQKKYFDSYSELLDAFYRQRDQHARMKVKSQGLSKLLNNTVERISRKINLQQADLEKCRNREILRIKADLLQVNLFRVERGAQSIRVENFYDEDQKMIDIELNPALTPAMNAQKYYKAYAKAKNGEKMLMMQIEKSKEDLQYIESVMDSLSRAETEKELSMIRSELVQEGFLKEQKGSKKKEQTLPPHQYMSKSGFSILVGRNNKQNDILTLKYAKKSDIWLHTKDIPGSHVIIEANGRQIDEETVAFAAKIAAFHSKAQKSSNVPVDYTNVKYVSKPRGAKPGKVIYTDYKTKYVDPEDGEEKSTALR